MSKEVKCDIIGEYCYDKKEVWCNSCMKKKIKLALSTQKQEFRDMVGKGISPDALSVSKRIRKELGKGRPITENMVLGACMGNDYARQDILEAY